MTEHRFGPRPAYGGEKSMGLTAIKGRDHLALMLAEAAQRGAGKTAYKP